jgi:hypothetical protein
MAYYCPTVRMLQKAAAVRLVAADDEHVQAAGVSRLLLAMLLQNLLCSVAPCFWAVGDCSFGFFVGRWLAVHALACDAGLGAFSRSMEAATCSWLLCSLARETPGV